MADPGNAAEHGFGIVEGFSDIDPMQAIVDRLSEPQRQRYMLDLLGPSTAVRYVKLNLGGAGLYGSNGCLAEARKKIYGDIGLYLYLTQDLQTLHQQLLVSSKRAAVYSQALNAWTSCMSTAGKRFPNPVMAADSIRTAMAKRALPLAKLQADEKRLAVVAATCDLHSALSAQLRQAFTASIRAISGLTRAWLDPLIQARSIALTNATQIIASAHEGVTAVASAGGSSATMIK